MRKIFFGILFTCILALGQQKPKLVIGIVVDQMRMDYLYRFYDDFSAKGFKKIMNNGFVFHNVHYNYTPTVTGPGHASVYSGTTPSNHGIVENEWFSKIEDKEVYCVEDDLVKTLGNGLEKEGKMSPRRMLSTTITDELKLFSNMKSKVIGVSIKDRGAILPAGHFADAAYWFADSGAFISSTFYFDKLPAWVEDFNNKKVFEKYLNSSWNLLKDKSIYNESLNDVNDFEGKMFKKPAFMPYNLQELYKENNARILRSTPFGNDYLLDFSRKAIENENLGADTITDFLTISFSSPDIIGHTLGIRSLEMQDVYLRLDESLAQFIEYLDQKVGKNDYLLFLTADHAGAETPGYLKSNKYHVEAVNYKNLKSELVEFSKKIFGEDYIKEVNSQNIYFKQDLIKEKGRTLEEILKVFKDFLYTKNYIKKAYTELEILSGNSNDELLNFVQNGYDYTQNGQLLYVLKPGFMEYYGYGTTHGSHYNYDTHVPVLFYGKNIPKGSSVSKKSITQLAGTIAQLLKIGFPNAANTNIMEELFVNETEKRVKVTK